VPSQAAEKAGRLGFGSTVLRADRKSDGKGAADEALADLAEFVVNPEGYIEAVAPNQDRTGCKERVTGKGEKTERGTGTPIQQNLFRAVGCFRW